MDEHERSQRALDAEDVALMMRRVMDAERRHEACLADVARLRQDYAKAKRKTLEASWDVTNARVAYLRATASMRTDEEGLPLNEPDRSIEISRRNAARRDAEEKPKPKRRKVGPLRINDNGEQEGNP